MNIKQAKEEIKNTIQAYLQKDSYGNYKITYCTSKTCFAYRRSGHRQNSHYGTNRKRMYIGIVSYTITHHTRQSAIGLPFIQKKIYAGKEYSVQNIP